MTTVFFDTETAGLLDYHPTIQIAAVAMSDDWRELATFERKIKFDRKLEHEQALAMNSYDEAVWQKEAIPEIDAMTQFCNFLRPHCCVNRVSKAGRPYKVARLAGHNAATFDHPRISESCKAFGLFLPNDFPILDTMILAGWHFAFKPKPPSFKLTELCKHFEIHVADAHDALADARMAAQLAKVLIGGRAAAAA